MVLREMNTTPTFRIYRNGVQQAALEATFSADGWSIPLFRADFLHSTSKSVEVSPNLPPDDKNARARGAQAIYLT
jgi:hypothetical protein